MNIVVKTRHMEATDAIKSYVETKVAKLPKYYDNISMIEVVLDHEADLPKVEIIAHAKRKQTFVASHRQDDMYACVDRSFDKISEQLRRHKEKVRDRQGAPHSETMR